MRPQSSITQFILLLSILNIGSSQCINADPGSLHQRKFTILNTSFANNGQQQIFQPNIQPTHHESLTCCAIITQGCIEMVKDKSYACSRSIRCKKRVERDTSHLHPEVDACRRYGNCIIFIAAGVILFK